MYSTDDLNQITEAEIVRRNKEEFISIYKEKIKREGADKLLEYLEKSDFFEAPASARYHLSCPGGLCEHSLNVYDCLCDNMTREKVREKCGNPSDETLAIVSLLHDLCKIDFYKKSTRNVKNEATGMWEKKPCYEIEDTLPYGHGEKSVYIISGFMRLTREEAFAIRYHMGFASTSEDRDVSSAFQKFPLAFAVATADSEATFYIEQ